MRWGSCRPRDIHKRAPASRGWPVLALLVTYETHAPADVRLLVRMCCSQSVRMPEDLESLRGELERERRSFAMLSPVSPRSASAYGHDAFLAQPHARVEYVPVHG